MAVTIAGRVPRGMMDVGYWLLAVGYWLLAVGRTTTAEVLH
jgi:hypothetical protein